MKTYVLYRNNRISEKFEIDLDLIKTRYKEFLVTKGFDWMDYYSRFISIVTFITDKEWLSSTPETELYYEDLETELKEIWGDTYTEFVINNQS